MHIIYIKNTEKLHNVQVLLHLRCSNMAEFLQRGFECDGGKANNSGPRGTGEVTNPRKEILENIENQDTNNLHFLLDATEISTPIPDLINVGMYAVEGNLL